MARTIVASPLTLNVTNYIQTMRQTLTRSWNEVVRHGDGRVITVYRGAVVLPEDYLHRLLAVCSVRDALFSSCVYWRSPGGAVRVGLGAAVDQAISGERRFEEVKAVIARHPVTLHRDGTDDGIDAGSDDGNGKVSAKWFVGGAFVAQPRRQPWQNWPDARALLPEFVFEQTAAGRATITCHIVTEPSERVGNDLSGVIDRVERQLRLVAELAGEVSGRVMEQDGSPTQYNVLPNPTAPPDEAHAFMSAVAATSADIRAQKYAKAVLARRAVTARSEQMSVDHVIRRLEEQNHETFVYAVRTGDEWFIGASPERLVRLFGGNVAVDCLAGTIARGAGDEEDNALGRTLLDSAKDRQEHHVVVHWVTETLEGAVDDLAVGAVPTLRKLQSVQHLWTAVSGHVHPGATVLDLVDRLHPTPAVAGMPRDVALDVITEREQMDRGWYAGPIGWADSTGDGEFAVALRSALFTSAEVHLYAGAGIMGDSKPESEWRETALKLRAMQAAIAPHTNDAVATSHTRAGDGE